VGAEYQVSVFGLLNQQVPTPGLSPSAGAYPGALSVTISDASFGSFIFYTIDGSTPTVSSLRYSGPITILQSTVVQAMATSKGMTNSDVARAAYTIQKQRTWAPASVHRAEPTQVVGR
jgi:hypothetical protein